MIAVIVSQSPLQCYSRFLLVLHRKLLLSTLTFIYFSDAVLEVRPWPRGASRPIFMVLALALASGSMALALAPVALALALASKVQALALRAALTLFCHHHRTHGPTTTTTKESKIIN